MKCPNCGERLPEGARFCGACGNEIAEPVNMDAAELAPAKGNTVSPEAKDMSAGSAQNSPDPGVPKAQGGQPASGKSGKNNVLPVILIAAVIAMIVMVNVIMALLPTDEERWQEQYDLGEQYLLDGDYEQAIVAFTAAIEIDANISEAYLGRAEAYLGGDVESASGDNLQLALADYDTAILLDDANADAYESRGDVNRALGAEENLTSALADYDAALALDDSRADLYLTGAAIYLLLDDYPGAVQAYTGAIGGGIGTAETYLGRADAYYVLGMDDIGEEETEAEIEDLTDAERSYLTAALDDYEEVLEMGGVSEDTYIHAARICVIMGDYDRAAEILAEGEETYPNSETISEAVEKVAALLEERERQALIAEQRQEIEEKYLDLLLSLAQTFYEDPESMGYSDLVGDELRDFIADLEETQFWEQENGLVLGVYPYGYTYYIYYGEMEDGQRTGYGIWFHCGSDDISEMEAGDFQIVNTIFAGAWDADYPNGEGDLYRFLRGWSYEWTYGVMEEEEELRHWEMTFVNGLGDGTGTFYYSTTDELSSSGSTSVTAENGKWVSAGELEDGYSYYAHIGGTYFSVLSDIRIERAYVTEK